MILYPNDVALSGRTREEVPNQATDFPYAAMEANLNIYPGRCAQWHWHDHFEIGIVHQGRATLDMERGSVTLSEGEGYFLNANTLHQIRTADGAQLGKMHTQLFDRSIIAGTGLAMRLYVLPIVNCPALDALILSPQNPDHAPLLEQVLAAFAAAEGDLEGHELEISARLTDAWRRLLPLAKPLLHSGGLPSESSRRVKEMLTFIHENYARALQVADIAAVSGVCERECYRCFASALNTTPMDYLARHRVAVAAQMLRGSSASIAEVAAACGFADPSYFGKVFRRVLGMTPGEYRRGR